MPPRARSTRPSLRWSAALLLSFLLSAAGSARSAEQAQDPSDSQAGESLKLPGDHRLEDLEIQVWGPWRQTAERDYLFEGKVTISWQEQRIQADRMSLKQQRYIEAEGNVLILWQGNRISGSRITYDLETERGVIEHAMGEVQGDFVFWAKRAEKVGDRTVHLTSATVTTCTQPVPYWSFYVTSATITLDRYARMWNVVVRASKVPFFYSPFLLWPVKEERALGLLMPEFHTNETLGNSMAERLFIPIGRSADVTLLGAYYSQAGIGFGGRGRLIPNAKGAATISGFWINDQASTKPDGTLWGKRYNVVYNQTQELRNGFRLAADVNVVSDFSYYSDYERDLNLVSTPAVLQRIELSRNQRWGSMNAREWRRAQFLGTVINPATLASEESVLLQQSLPEIEWRGKNRKLGKTPLYLQYEASMASIQQREMNVYLRPAFQADYFRGDLFPVLTLPWSPRPWIDITPRVSYRWTYYTQQQTFGQNPLYPNSAQTVRLPVDEPLTRNLWGASLTVTGPKFGRIFGDPSGRQFKHSIEPRLNYGYETSFADTSDIIRFDEVDVFNGAGNAVNYSLINRLFTKKPRQTESTGAVTDEAIVMPDGTVSQPESPPSESTETASSATPPPAESVEIASLEIGQTRSFDEYLTTADFNGDGVTDDQSRYSDVVVLGRYNPDPNTTVDIRGNYNILWNTFSGVTLSGGIRRKLAQLRFSLVFRNGLGGTQINDPESGETVFIPNENDTQMRLTTGFSLLRGKLRFVVDGTVDFDPKLDLNTGTRNYVPNKAWRVQYSTQCCTVYLERLDRTYTGANRQDFYFRVDFKGIGKILQVTY